MITVANVVLMQKNLYNGHGQLEISEMSYQDLQAVLVELEEISPKGYYLRTSSDGSGGVYEIEGLEEVDRLVLSVDVVTTT